MEPETVNICLIPTRKSIFCTPHSRVIFIYSKWSFASINPNLHFRFTHIDAGILSYYLFSTLDGEQAPVFDFEEPQFIDNYRLKERLRKSHAGLAATLIGAILFEYMENSEFVISLL